MSATAAANDMIYSFLNVRNGRMVGIGGVVPMKHDIRLGKVVVSAPHDGTDGAFQYDLSKDIRGQRFHHTTVFNNPRLELRTAVSGIRAKYQIKFKEAEAVHQETLEPRERLHR